MALQPIIQCRWFFEHPRDCQISIHSNLCRRNMQVLHPVHAAVQFSWETVSGQTVSKIRRVGQLPKTLTTLCCMHIENMGRLKRIDSASVVRIPSHLRSAAHNLDAP